MRTLTTMVVVLSACAGSPATADVDAAAPDATAQDTSALAPDVVPEFDAPDVQTPSDAPADRGADAPDVQAARDVVDVPAPQDTWCRGIGEAVCGGECVYTHSNASHCGGCDRPCAQAGQGNPRVVRGLCRDSRCVYECAPNMAHCNPESTDACSVHLNTDPRNCGACGVVCGTGTCRDGRCVPR